MALIIPTKTVAHRAGAQLPLASDKRISTPVEPPRSLAVSMKPQAAINRLCGVQVKLGKLISFPELQDGLLDSIGKIVAQMSELKGLARKDLIKSAHERTNYNDEFKDLQVHLHDISKMKCHEIALYSNFTAEKASGDACVNTNTQSASFNNTFAIFISVNDAPGSKVSLHESLLLCALTLNMDRAIVNDQKSNDSCAEIVQAWSRITYTGKPSPNSNELLSSPVQSVSHGFEIVQITVGVISKALDDI